jgi:DNA-binding CsgD family transcriptional regulator/tetratricopeptide (TPR) repeat protein
MNRRRSKTSGRFAIGYVAGLTHDPDCQSAKRSMTGMVCPSCGAETRVGARFCDVCGARVASVVDRAEYKQATVMFDDVGDSMSIAAAVGAERFREVMTEFARTLYHQGKPQQAEEIFARFDPDTLDEMQLLRWGIPRFSILFWAIGDVEQANQVLALMRARVAHPRLKLLIDGIESAMAVHENRIVEGLATAEQVLSDPHAPQQALDFAAFAAGVAMPFAGRGHDFEPIAARCRAQHDTDTMIQAMLPYCDVEALVSTGQLDLADKRAGDYGALTSAGWFLPWAIAKITAGLVTLYRGRFPDAISSIAPAVATLATEATSGPWILPARLLLARAYAALGRVAEAQRVLADAEEHRGRFVAIWEPHVIIAKSWLAAAEGTQRRAVELARAAAVAARESGQCAVEAEALHHAARFGDGTVARRLQELVDHVDGNVVALQARHAAAVCAADAAALDAVSVQFEDAGLLLSAADSAAQAAPLHGPASQRHKALHSSARALRLADVCGGASTPAIKVAAKPLPVTAREREIAMLISAGLSNREIAGRLTVSIRTVEGHIYRACYKLDVNDRDELAKLIGTNSQS